MQNTPIIINVIGAGVRTTSVLKSVPGMGERFIVRQAFDPKPHMIQQMAAALGQPVQAAPSLEALVSDPEASWVIIGSPNAFHAEHTLAAIHAGKHVFCEKPLATTFEDAMNVVRAHRTGPTTPQGDPRHLTVGFVLRATYHYAGIAERVQRGDLGKIISLEFNETLTLDHGVHIHGNWRRFSALGGGHLLEKCCHDLDIIQWLLGTRATRVASFGGRRFFNPDQQHLLPHGISPSRRHLPTDQWFDEHHVDPFTSEKDIVDHQTALIEFDGGVQATFHTNCATALPERRLYLCGTEGTLRADLRTGRTEIGRFDREGVEVLDVDLTGGHGGGDHRMGDQWAEQMLGGQAPLAKVEAGLEATLVAIAIEQARHSGQVVDLAPWWKQVEELPDAEPAVAVVL